MIRVAMAVAVAALVAGRQTGDAPAREMAITVDDLPVVSAVDRSAAHFTRVTTGIVDAFVRHRVPGIGFVNESKLEIDGVPAASQVALLQQWVDAGFELGNHTYSHLDLHLVPLADFVSDLVRGEEVTGQLMTRARRRLRYFRHPFLHTGRSAESRREIETLLRGRGYRVAPVTIDNADYIFAAAYDRHVAAERHGDAERVFVAYLDYMTRVVEYYEQQSVALLGRPMRHVLLTHANALNARAFPQWLPVLERRGYRFISLDRALDDEAFATRRDEYYGPSGMTWLHRWAITEGKRGDFFAGEPEVPAWVQEASKSGE
jgi:peptidoglycan/xylan/chitin deacetylase (PgdA/CDA1 family)